MPTICGVPVTLLLDLPVLQSLHFLKKVFKTSSEKCGERRYNGGVDKGGEVFVRDANMVGCNSHYGHGLRVSLGSTVHIPWLKKTRRKALFASLEKIKEGLELDILRTMPNQSSGFQLLMLLGLISLLLGQWARVISQICVDSSLFSTKFFICSEEDYGMVDAFSITKLFSLNETDIPPKGISNPSSHQCGEGREPFVSYQGLEQLHRFLFVLGMTHVLYSCIAVGLAMSKVYSWGKWEDQASILSDGNLQAKKNKVMRRQSTFILHRASHPWSRSRVLIWMLVMLVGTKLQHVVSVLALEIVEPRGPSTATQVKPRDDLFWFGKPDILLRLIQFISFQNAFEMATFIWSLMGSRCKKALIAESVRDSLHSWCKRVKEKSRRDALHSITTRSTCSLGSTIDEGDEVITIASGTLSPCSSNGSLNRLDENMVSTDHLENATNETFHQSQHEVSFRISECSANPISNGPSQPMMTGAEDNAVERDGEKVETLMDLFRKT
ncbi:hypothetical protein RJ639_021505 [Escallonia herrerae]|uniref:MLO-like protein n=1 Tax=Escallonia herrerae TaxID=1293975 RepID=A0AA89AGC7_9ASTE|nr:hypothetical protein RJ639_021505 [Escallonia herrerae]